MTGPEEVDVKSTTKAIKALQQPLPAQTREDLAQLGFRPAFMDFATMAVYLSCYADGRPAPIHLAEGLPSEVIAIRSSCGRVIAAKATLIAGYERQGLFYTRATATRVAGEWPLNNDRGSRGDRA